MRRFIPRQHPFYHEPRFAFGYELLPENVKVLDYGCHDGAFGQRLTRHKKVEYLGVDKNRDAVRRAPPGILVKELVHPLPFDDAEFDAVTMFEVIEHIYDQDAVLREVHRVLKPGGIVIVSVPRRHVFTVLDLANFKFVFPRLHRLYYSLTRSPAAYRERYLTNPHGLVGDVEREKRWHQHFRDDEMRSLLERNGFSVEEMDGSGLFSLVITFLTYILRLGFLFPQRVHDWDSHTFHSSGLLCAARKPAGRAAHEPAS